MKAVKDVLKQKAVPKDYPPTMADVKMREKHVPESVHYNVDKHMKDHGSNAITQIKKVHMVNPSQAHQLAQHSIEVMKGIIADFEKHTNSNCKECSK
jgi:hypothetical protein